MPLFEQDMAAKITAMREGMSVTRRQFCISLKRLGYLTGEQAQQAAKGDMPLQFAEAVTLSNMTPQQKDEAAITWAALTEVQRLHPLIAVVQSYMQLTDAQVDEIFETAEAIE